MNGGNWVSVNTLEESSSDLKKSLFFKKHKNATICWAVIRRFNTVRLLFWTMTRFMLSASKMCQRKTWPCVKCWAPSARPPMSAKSGEGLPLIFMDVSSSEQANPPRPDRVKQRGLGCWDEVQSMEMLLRLPANMEGVNTWASQVRHRRSAPGRSSNKPEKVTGWRVTLHSVQTH